MILNDLKSISALRSKQNCESDNGYTRLVERALTKLYHAVRRCRNFGENGVIMFAKHDMKVTTLHPSKPVDEFLLKTDMQFELKHLSDYLEASEPPPQSKMVRQQEKGRESAKSWNHVRSCRR